MASEEMMFRVATLSDLEPSVRITSLFRDHLGRPGPADEELRFGLSRLLADPDTEFIIAVAAGGQVLAFAQLRFRYSVWVIGNAAEIEDLYVIDSARHSGIGRKLVSLALDRARSRGCRIIGLNTNESNVSALSFYKALGFDSERTSWQGGRQLWLTRTFTD
jgi:ribosomal protein S18 acetylase RimI-like enzyme